MKTAWSKSLGFCAFTESSFGGMMKTSGLGLRGEMEAELDWDPPVFSFL